MRQYIWIYKYVSEFELILHKLWDMKLWFKCYKYNLYFVLGNRINYKYFLSI